MNIWGIFQIALTVFEVGMCLWICDVVVYDGERVKGNKGYIIMGMFPLLLIVAGNRRNVFFSWPILLFQICFTWLLLAFRKRNNKVLCFACVLDYYLLVSLMDLSLAFWGASRLDDQFWESLYYKATVGRVFIYFLTRSVLFGMCLLLYRYKKKHYFSIEDYREVLFFIGAVGSIWGWLLLMVLVDHADHVSQMNSFLVISCLLILLVLMTIELKSTHVKTQAKMLQMKNDLLEQNYKSLQELYRNNQYLFHDFKNHMILLKNYMKHREYDKAGQYLEEITEPVEQLSNYIYTGCGILDLVLNIKGDEAKRKGIRYLVEADKDLKLPLNENDLGNIFFNLLDNAIEACERIEEKYRWIRVVIRKKQQIHIVKIENSIEDPAAMKDGEYRTTKADPEFHGLGMKSVEACVKRYGGNVSWSHTKDRFTVVITFFENGL